MMPNLQFCITTLDLASLSAIGLLHTNVGYDSILSKFSFQGPGLKVKVTAAIF